MPMPTGAEKIAELARVGLYYERRESTDRWGDLMPNEAFAPYATPRFKDKLYFAFDSLWPFIGQPSGIVSAGAYVDKPGAHGRAEAFDLDGLVWVGPGKNWQWRASDYNTDLERRYYYGLMSHFMLFFGNVLGWEYNAAHKDHIHLDNEVAVGFRPNSHAIVTSLQGMLKYVWEKDLVIDGDYGPKTAEALAAKTYLTDSQYKSFLVETRQRAFTPMIAPKTTSPFEELEQRLVKLTNDFEEYKRTHT